MSRWAVGMMACLVVAVSVGAPAAAAAAAEPGGGQVVVVAGSGEEGYSGDGHRATDARIGSGGSIAVGPDGTLYLADHFSGRVRSVDDDGIIDTVPGSRALRSPETDGPDVNGWQYSPSDRPSAVTVTSDGTMYVAGSETVRRLAPDGTSTFIADIGQTFTFASDVAVDGAGNVYVGGSDEVVKIDPAGTMTPFAGGGPLDPFDADGKPATEARLSGHDIRIAADADGSVYVVAPAEAPAVPSLHRVDPDGTMHTVAGGRTAGFKGDGGPAEEALLSLQLGGVAVDQDGNVYLHDQGNRVVRVIDPEGVISTVLPPVAIYDQGQTAMAVGPNGDIYLRNGTRVHRVVRDYSAPEVDPADAADYPSPFPDDEPGTVHVVAGTGEQGRGNPPVVEEPTQPMMRIAVGPDGSRYYSDTYQNRVMKVAADGTTSVFVGKGEDGYSGDGGKATEAGVSLPLGLDVGPDGSVYIAESGSERVRKVDPNGVITTVAGNGVAGDPGGTFGEKVAIHGDGGPATQATVTPSDVAVAEDGSLYIAEDDNKRIRRVAPDGTISTIAGGGERWQDDADGHPAAEADFFHLLAIELGRDGRVYVLDDGVEFIRPAVRMIDPAGIMRTVAGSSYRSEEEAGFGGDGGRADAAELNNPRDLAVGPDGVLYIADAYNARVRAVDPNGTITTFVGTGERADSGDDGQATAAAVNEPQAVAVGADGVVSVIGMAGDRIREIENGTITTLATLEEQAAPGDEPALEMPVNAESIAVDHDGGLLINQVFGPLSKVDADGVFTRPFGQPELADVQAAAVAPDGTRYVAAENVVYRVTEDEAVLVAGGGPEGAEEDRVVADEDAKLASFGTVKDLAVSPGGRLYVATTQNVFRVEEDGRAAPAYSGDKALEGIAVDGDERLYVAVPEVNQVFGVSADGERATVAGNGSLRTPGEDVDGEDATEVGLDKPSDVAVDADGNVYVSNYDGIHRVDPGGTIVKVADNPWVDGSRGSITRLAFDRHGNLYYVDNTTLQVKVVVQPGEISGPFNWAMAIWIAVVLLALAVGGWFGREWWRHRKSVADGASADGVGASPAEAPPGESTVDTPAEGRGGPAPAGGPAAGGSAVDGTSAAGVGADEPTKGASPTPAEVPAPDGSTVDDPAEGAGGPAVAGGSAAGESVVDTPTEGAGGPAVGGESGEGSGGGAADETGTTPPSGG